MIVTSAPIQSLDVSVYVVPTEEPESDGTLTWDATTVVVVDVGGGGERGLGFSYATGACARLIDDLLREVVIGSDALDVVGTWARMVRAIRNMGRPGVSSMAIAAVDCALWDLKAKLFGVSLADLLGKVRDEVPVYGSGGFTSLTDKQLDRQLGEWAGDLSIPRVKIKIAEAWGSCESRDLERAARARRVIGKECELFVDANGGYTPKQAVRVGERLAELDVRWFEEPVSSDHLASLAEVRSLVPMEVTAGEYGYDLFYFEAMCDAGAVDCLQADVSRCAGVTEWLRVASVAEAHGLQISGHCAQSLHAHPACAVTNLRHLEYFADHARVDRLLFEGVLDPVGGVLHPDPDRFGHGLSLKHQEASRFLVG